MFECRHCRARLGWAVDYCPYCGLPQHGEAPVPASPAGEAPPEIPAPQAPEAIGEKAPPARPAPKLAGNLRPRLFGKPPRPAHRRRKASRALAVLAVLGLASVLAWEPLAAFLRALLPVALEPAMVSVKPGCFEMGSPKSEAGRDADERPHKVCVDGFLMSQYETTFDEYAAFARSTGRPLPPDDGHGRGRRPVIGVSWEEARAYAAWLSKQTGKRYRLPTEAEWEYAARAGAETMAWWGDAPDLKRLCEYANYADCPRSPGRTIPVGSLRPNPWGLYDVLGNVFEMTGSAYDKNYGGAEKRQAVPDDKALYAVRGGSWHPQIDTLRLAWRGRTDKASKRVKWQMGFRLARD